MLRQATWIAVAGLAVAVLGHFVLHDWRVAVVGGSIGFVAIGALIINSEGKGNGS